MAMAPATTDLCDKYFDQVVQAGNVRVLSPLPPFHSFGKRRCFSGQITTLKVFEDNTLVRAALEQPGGARVLVVDGGGSLRCALMGGDLASSAAKNEWAGVVINGCVRDVAEIDAEDVGVRALATHPLKSFKRGHGERDVAVAFAGVRIRPGDWCYADDDGIVVSDEPLVV